MVNHSLDLAGAEAEYDKMCQQLSTLNLDIDAHAIAHTFCQRMMEEKQSNETVHPDEASVTAHADRHLTLVNQTGKLQQEMDEWRSYISYLRAGGEVSNPFWEDDTSIDHLTPASMIGGSGVSYPINPEG